MRASSSLHEPRDFLVEMKLRKVLLVGATEQICQKRVERIIAELSIIIIHGHPPPSSDSPSFGAE